MLRNFYKRLKERLSRKYRVELIDDITLSRSREFILKPITVIVFALLLLIGIVGGTAAVVLYTPAIHKHIPGYIDPDEFAAFEARTTRQLIALERQMNNIDTVRRSIQQISGLEEDMLVPPSAHMTPDPTPDVVEVADKQTDPVNDVPAEEAATVSYTNAEPYYAPETKAIRATYFSPLMNLFPPVEGKIRNPFDTENSHYGVDIVADEKALVRSVMDGFVVVSEYSDENGYMIGVSSGDNLIAFYKHNSINYKKVGSYVFAGEPIAVIGNSGENSTGPHLHFELWQDGQPIDPAEFIKFNQ